MNNILFTSSHHPATPPGSAVCSLPSPNLRAGHPTIEQSQSRRKPCACPHDQVHYRPSKIVAPVLDSPAPRVRADGAQGTGKWVGFRMLMPHVRTCLVHGVHPARPHTMACSAVSLGLGLPFFPFPARRPAAGPEFSACTSTSDQDRAAVEGCTAAGGGVVQCLVAGLARCPVGRPIFSWALGRVQC